MEKSEPAKKENEMHQVIVAGDRDYLDKEHIRTEMNRLWDDIGPYEVISGCARGVDTISGNLAAEAGLTIHSYPADWNRYGKSAGPVRNRQMLNHPATYLLAFMDIEHSKGTLNMVNQCDVAGIPVRVIAIKKGEGKWAFPATS